MKLEFIRSALLFGSANIEKLQRKKVAVLGVGGVGSYTVEALARGGIGSLLLVDNDTVDITNINRQLPATHNAIGEFKTKILAQRVRTINPDIQVETHEVFILGDNIDKVLSTDIDYIVDSLDTITAKIAIVEFGVKYGIPVISCMGAGNKLDPTKFQVTDIYKTDTCPLCRVMRKELRKRKVDQLKVVYSTEPAYKPMLEEVPVEFREKKGEIGVRETPTPGSVSFVPPVAGMIAAGEVLKDLAGIS